MHIINTNEKEASEPQGHYGGLTTLDVVGPGVAKHLTIQISRGPVGSGAYMHSHEKSEQLFYVISGKLTMITENGERTVLEPGMAAYLAPNEGHETKNESNEAVISIVITSPQL